MTVPAATNEPVRLHEIYSAELRVHATTLILLGHSRLDAPSFVATDEDVITEKLVIAMKAAQADASSPEWVDRYEIHEQVPQNVADKHGKSRPKMDIQLERSGRGFRPKLGFEAKRLREVTGVRDYLGDEGMTAFLTGYYPTTHGEAGMLGYVQDSTASAWTTRITQQLTDSRDKFRVNAGRSVIAIPLSAPATASCFMSSHTDHSDNELRMIHVLLPFCR